MKMSSAFPSRYLQANDLPPGRSVLVTMADVKIEDIAGDDGREDKPVLYFQGKQKGLVLNKTNANTIADAYGDESDHWYGKPVEIFPTETEFRGRRVACLRVRVPRSQPPANQPAQPPAASAQASLPPQPAPNPNSGDAHHWPAQGQQPAQQPTSADNPPPLTDADWVADDAAHGDDIPF